MLASLMQARERERERERERIRKYCMITQEVTLACAAGCARLGLHAAKMSAGDDSKDGCWS